MLAGLPQLKLLVTLLRGWPGASHTLHKQECLSPGLASVWTVAGQQALGDWLLLSWGTAAPTPAMKA